MSYVVDVLQCLFHPHLDCDLVLQPTDCEDWGLEWHNIGWYRVDPGSCAVVYANDLDDVGNRYWYVYAEAEDGTTWDGDFPTQVHPLEAFNVCDGEGWTYLAYRGFRQLDVGNHEKFTATFLL